MAWGAFAYVGADLHLRFGLSFTAVGLIVGTFGIGGLLYAASVQQLVNRLGQPGPRDLRRRAAAASPIWSWRPALAWWLAPIAVTAIGLGFYALHNTLQTNATQMTPEARGTGGRDLLLGDLSRPDARRGGRRARLRPLQRGAAVRRDRGRAAGAGLVVRAQTAPEGGAGSTSGRPIMFAASVSRARATRARSRRAPAARPCPADCRRARS